MPEEPITGEFAFDQTWDAMQTLLSTQLPGVNVAAAGEKDFDDEGALITTPPAIRGVFSGEEAESFETQKLGYNAVQAFVVICIDKHLGPDPQMQRRKSGQLAAKVKHILVGARLLLPDGNRTSPVEYTGMAPLPTKIGMAYAAAFAVPSIAQFAGTNAQA
jgi:hypothetical protein